MATVCNLLTSKGRSLLTTSPNATVIDAAMLMNEHRVGSLMVVDDGQLVGMFTERDVLRRVVAEQRDPAATRVDEVMTAEVACCQLHTSLDEARTVMKNRRIRHLPVLSDEGDLIGLVSIGDLNAYQANSQEMTIHLLQQYIYGV